MKKLSLILILILVSICFSQPIGPRMTKERLEDYVGAMLAGVETLISVSYDDANSLLDFVVDEAGIDHDALTNFLAAEHIDWTASANDVNTTSTISAEQLTSTDDITAGDNFFASGGVYNAPSFTFTDDPDTGMYRVGANWIGFAASGSFVFGIKSTEFVAYQPFFMYQQTADAFSPRFGMYKNRATGVLTSDGIGKFNVYGRQAGTASFNEAGRLEFFALEDFDATHGGTRLVISLTALAATSPTDIVNITAEGMGVGIDSPNAVFHIKANTPGTVGSHPAGQLILQDPDDTVYGTAVITGYESDANGNPDQQLWYLGSASSGNSDTIFLNRRNSKLSLGTNDTSRITILGNGNVGIGRTDPTAGLSMAAGKLIAVDVNAGITADTNQSQGRGALTAQINEISTVANDDDTVTLPPAVAGIEIEIINNGVNTLQIFPASGDDLGLDVNTAEELEANERAKFVAYDTTNWTKESTTEIIHAEIHDEDNTDAFVINDAGADFHSYHTNGLAVGDVANWAFDAGGAGTSHAIASIADGVDSGNDIEVTTGDNHLLSVGDIVSQTNLADVNYVGIFDVKAIISATEYEVAAPFTADGTGTVDQAATLEADAVAAGVYSFAYCISAKPVGANETFDFRLYKEATAITGSKIRRKFGAGGDYGSMSGCGVVAVADGDKISLAVSNENSNANLTIRNLTVVLIRL